MKIVIVTDAWSPQVNGVVTTLSRVGACLRAAGHDVLFITPQMFPTLPCPTYPEIRLALPGGRRLSALLREFQPDAIHISTEGPLGHALRWHCLRRGLPFTTAYHTQFPQYLRLRMPLPLALSYGYLRRFHRPALRTLVATESVRRDLIRRGFEHVVLWNRGVDSALFRPREKEFIVDARPVAIYVGRVAVEKNLEDFLRLQWPGSKYVVGTGPDLPLLRQKYPAVRFIGRREGEELAAYMAAADVFVFPSRTDTFGLAMLEAMAAGVPVAAYPVAGPLDVVRHGETGYLHEDLAVAAREALKLDPTACVAYARSRTWEACAELLLSYLAPFDFAAATAHIATGRMKDLSE
ncbi:MAG TPA: glycosyltransferase family 1 protein [Gammaproteobacteria bacterium]|nr:glycosyltransferase family 1 protein [Gammaproteobacteria bacterium]